MGQVRWAGWAMVFAAAWVLSAGQAYADVASDKMAALLIYPKIEFDSSAGKDTVIRLTNTNPSQAILAHCFYLDANSHCHGGTNDRGICTNEPGACTGGGICRPGWNPLDSDFQAFGRSGWFVQRIFWSPNGICHNSARSVNTCMSASTYSPRPR